MPIFERPKEGPEPRICGHTEATAEATVCAHSSPPPSVSLCFLCVLDCRILGAPPPPPPSPLAHHNLLVLMTWECRLTICPEIWELWLS